MSSIQIQQIKCPECGGQLNSVGPFSPTKICAYCQAEFQVTGTMEKEMEPPERILVFGTNKDDFEKSVLELLAKEDYSPNDIFDHAAFKDVEGIYLPMYLYEGKYECAWNCSVGYTETQVVSTYDGKGVKDKDVMRYRPQSGSTKNNYAIVCAAYEGQEIKSELIDYARAFHYDKSSAKAFDPALLEGYNFVLHNLDKESTWDKWGEESIEYLAEDASLSQIPGEDFKDFMCSVSTEQKHDGRLVFLPFWVVYYDYQDEHHYAIMDGTGNTGITGSTPIDLGRVKQVEKWHKIAKYVKWGAWASLVGILLSWIIPVVVWAAFFGINFYAKFIEKDIIKQNKDIREAKLAEILKG
ncbi:MAG: hypothetical protein GQ527_08040 [Bacteroidales bacterium]|nr:hypothetical protein [Bacteroidales bacterium]